MKQTLFGFLILSLLLTGCGGTTPTSQPPVVLGSNSTGAGNGNYVNILLDSVEFTGKVSNLGNTGNVQLIIIVSDKYGHADALICPYGGVIEVNQGDKINPCNAGLAYPENLVQGNLYIMLIAMDVKDKSALADVGTNALSTGLAFGLQKAIEHLGPAVLGVEVAGPWAIAGFLALDVVVGYTGGEIEKYFQTNYVMADQSFVIAQNYNWNNGQPITASSTNSQANFTFTVQPSSSPEGKIYSIELPTPEEESLPVMTATASDDIIITTVKANRVYLRAGPDINHAGVSGMYNQGEQMEILSSYKDWVYVKSLKDGKAGWLYVGWINIESINLSIIATPSFIPPPPKKATRKPKPSYP